MQSEGSGDPIGLLTDLIRCPSVTPDEAGALDVVERFLAPLGFTCTRLKFEGDGSYPVDNLFATRGTGGPHLLFGGHTDVVPPGDDSLWTHPPFGAEIADDQMIGRGAIDMKSGVAAFCAAAARAIADGSADKGTISLVITNDEEADAINGTEKILAWAAANGHRFDFALVGEPSAAARVGDRIKIGRRGSYGGQVKVHGSQGHVAYPERALNPVPVAAAIVSALKAEPLDPGSERFQSSNLEVTTIDVGNKATNVIPAMASLSFNIRFNDLWDPDRLTAWVARRLSSVDAMGCRIEFVPPIRCAQSFVAPAGPALTLLNQTIAARYGAEPEASTTGGTSDARFIAKYCPVVELGLVGTGMHMADESVPLSEVEDLTALYAAFIKRYFGA